MKGVYLSKRIFSSTALALPLTFFVPTYGSNRGGEPQVNLEARIAPAIDQPTIFPLDKNILIVEDVAGEPDVPISLPIAVRLGKSYRINSVKLVCAQGELVLSDINHTYALESKDHVIDISDWDLSHIKLMQVGASERRVVFTVVVTYDLSSGSRSSSDFKDFSVEFRKTKGRSKVSVNSHVIEESGIIDLVQSSLEIEKRELVDLVRSDTFPSEIFVAEAPPIAPLEPGSRGGDQAGRASSMDHDRGTKVSQYAMVAPEKQALPSRNVEMPYGPVENAVALVKRARGLIQSGDISGARRLLEHARARNAPDATLLLAQTYDPERLRAWKVQGLKADPELARVLYERAAEQALPDGRRLTAIAR